MTTAPSIDSIDADVRRRAYATMAQEIRLLDDLILHVNHGTSALTGRQHDRGLNLLISLLVNRAFNSLWRAREDAICGYHAESLTLCRSVVEHWAAARWVEFHPEARDRWLWAVLEEVKRPAKNVPDVSQMLTELGDLGRRVAEMYDVLSKFAHPRSIGLRWLIHFDPETTHFHAGGHYDEHGLKVCLYFLIGMAQACLEPVARLQNRMLGSVDEAWLRRGKELSDTAEPFMEKVEREVAERVAQADRLTNGS